MNSIGQLQSRWYIRFILYRLLTSCLVYKSGEGEGGHSNGFPLFCGDILRGYLSGEDIKMP